MKSLSPLPLRLIFLALWALGACGLEDAGEEAPCVDPDSAACARCLSEALEGRCGETGRLSALACQHCEPMGPGCDPELCEAARRSQEQCEEEAARSRCGSGRPPLDEPAGGAGGIGGEGGGGGDAGGSEGAGGSGGQGEVGACIEMCGQIYRSCEMILPGVPTRASCEEMCDGDEIPSEQVTCIRAAACAEGEIATCLAGAGAGGSGGSEEPPIDRCGAVPPEGICEGSERLLFCARAPGQNEQTVFRQNCGPWAICEEGEGGAACAPREDACRSSDSFCVGEVRYLCEGGNWIPSDCDGACETTPYGAACFRGAEMSEVVTGTLAYEARLPKDNLSGMGELVQAPAGGLVVVSYRDDTAIDTAWVQEDGSFSIRLPSPRSAARDVIAFFTYEPGLSGELPAMAVMRSRLPKGSHDFRQAPLDPYPHHWTLPGDAEDGREWLVREENRSAAIFIFQWMRATAAFTRLHYDGELGKPFLLWWEPGINWSTCLGCYASHRVRTLGRTYDQHVLVSDAAGNALQWSSPFLGHELGHWAMDSYGYPPGEGGRHCARVPSLPGLAWSEGWATFFSCDVRGDSRYWAQQQGTFWWMDLSTDRYYGVSPFLKPSPQEGLEQRLPEEWVAGALWRFSRDREVDANLPHRALASPGMTKAPFGRGYTAKLSEVGPNCEPTSIVDTRKPAPMLADFLDALRCGGASAGLVEAHFSPYPYPADAPICR